MLNTQVVVVVVSHHVVVVSGQEVYSCNFHPTDSSIATSGGMDDKAYVWNVETGDTLLECAGQLL